MVAEQQPRIDDSENYVVQRQCGCRTVFLGFCHHRDSRFYPCIHHGRRDQEALRNKFVREAREGLEMAKLKQPPR